MKSRPLLVIAGLAVMALITGGAQIVESNLKGENGMIHVIDNVLMP